MRRSSGAKGTRYFPRVYGPYKRNTRIHDGPITIFDGEKKKKRPHATRDGNRFQWTSLSVLLFILASPRFVDRGHQSERWTDRRSKSGACRVIFFQRSVFHVLSRKLRPSITEYFFPFCLGMASSPEFRFPMDHHHHHHLLDAPVRQQQVFLRSARHSVRKDWNSLILRM